MKPRFLVTGGTGFLGQYVLEELRKKASVDVISRSQAGDLKGDLSRWDAGLNLDSLQNKKYDLFLHMAALYDLTASESDLYIQNVMGTDTALQVAGKLKIPYFVNISSIAAAANINSSLVSAYDRDFTSSFPDFYSESKARAEELVENDVSSIQSKLNLRLGILVGDTQLGSIQRHDGAYEVASFIKKLKPWIESWPLPLILPGNPKVKLPFVPVDQAAQGVVSLCLWMIKKKPTDYQSFHLVPKNGVSVAEIYQSTFQHLDIKNKHFQLVRFAPHKLLETIKKISPSFPIEILKYSLQLPEFESDSTMKILGSNWCSEFFEYETTFWSGYEKNF